MSLQQRVLLHINVALSVGNLKIWSLARLVGLHIKIFLLGQTQIGLRILLSGM